MANLAERAALDPGGDAAATMVFWAKPRFDEGPCVTPTMVFSLEQRRDEGRFKAVSCLPAG
ncbi:hypothetical protein PIB30_029732 [Stylosanthes scabra]|uniref:Uncharacterized protein n=1 Tax=Stylosanthes scabra TaxID=79078 RepID=A0ABU6Y8K1_9FABA|nr:hypothetical protein [Stylosanthes scabra]